MLRLENSVFVGKSQMQQGVKLMMMRETFQASEAARPLFDEIKDFEKQVI